MELAHNCILIHQPGEPFADYWGQECNDPEGKVNYGGMNRTAGGGRVAAFGTNHLHLIQVGDRSLPGMTEAKLLEADGIVGVSFQADDRSVSVVFGAVGGPSGHIRIAARGANLTDKELATSVMPQAGIGVPENPLSQNPRQPKSRHTDARWNRLSHNWRHVWVNPPQKPLCVSQFAAPRGP